MRYHPHTEADIRQMLQAVGVAELDDLFASIPEVLRLTRPPELPPALSERELVGQLGRLAKANRIPGQDFVSFLGAGLYAHQIPAVVGALASRGEFLTAYTPYQPEVSQGTLQAIFEFQTMVAELLGVEVANASMYDGATATVEAVLMCLRILRADGGTVAASRGLHPQYREVMATYLDSGRITPIPLHEGATTADATSVALSRAKGGVVIVQQP
ncbi:MAG: glycine dehydrogenase, partial [Deltaproteobacteria bacterium]|nr:glycine dehydrogenase [Deltaproteobacteria bacterium]